MSAGPEISQAFVVCVSAVFTQNILLTVVQVAAFIAAFGSAPFPLVESPVDEALSSDNQHALVTVVPRIFNDPRRHFSSERNRYM